MIIVAESVDGDALTTLILNKLRGLPLTAVKAPGFGENRKLMMQDMAIFTGGIVNSDEAGVKLEDMTLKHLGRAKKVVMTQDDTILMEGKGTKDSIVKRCDELREHIKQATSDYEKDKLQQRLAKLSGGIAVIKVGGASEVEVGERRDRITDAVNATRAAVAEGIVPGGGVALLRASSALDRLKGDNFDQNVGVKIVQVALRMPTRSIAKNAGA